MATSDFEHAVKFGEKRFEAGLLSKADGNILYVDEVNLLSDHIVKALLESASSGMNIVEREGVSYRHAAKFILIGSMNPEEGGLSPTVFGQVRACMWRLAVNRISANGRKSSGGVSNMKNAPTSFLDKWQTENEKLLNHVREAKEALEEIVVTDNAMQLAASIARESNCAGHRAELVVIETAKAIAAYNQRTVLNISDIKEAAKYALPHRARQADTQQEEPPPETPDENENETPEENKDTNQKTMRLETIIKRRQQESPPAPKEQERQEREQEQNQPVDALDDSMDDNDFDQQHSGQDETIFDPRADL